MTFSIPYLNFSIEMALIIAALVLISHRRRIIRRKDVIKTYIGVATSILIPLSLVVLAGETFYLQTPDHLLLFSTMFMYLGAIYPIIYIRSIKAQSIIDRGSDLTQDEWYESAANLFGEACITIGTILAVFAILNGGVSSHQDRLDATSNSCLKAMRSAMLDRAKEEISPNAGGKTKETEFSYLSRFCGET